MGTQPPGKEATGSRLRISIIPPPAPPPAVLGGGAPEARRLQAAQWKPVTAPEAEVRHRPAGPGGRHSGKGPGPLDSGRNTRAVPPALQMAAWQGHGDSGQRHLQEARAQSWSRDLQGNWADETPNFSPGRKHPPWEEGRGPRVMLLSAAAHRPPVFTKASSALRGSPFSIRVKESFPKWAFKLVLQAFKNSSYKNHFFNTQEQTFPFKNLIFKTK